MALDILDFLMDEGKMPLFTQVSSKDFLSTLVSILKTRGSSIVQEKILYLLKKWGVKFEKQKDIIPLFSEIYVQLQKSNTVFPNFSKPEYSKYFYGEEESNIKSFKNNSINEGNNNNNRISNNDNKFSDDSLENGKTSNYSYKNYIDINPDKFPNKYKKFVVELNIWMDNITLANVIIDFMKL